MLEIETTITKIDADSIDELSCDCGGHHNWHFITPIKAEPKTGRNEPCPCGSEKKYKKCCGK